MLGRVGSVVRGQLPSVLRWDRLQQGKFKLDINNNKKKSGSKMNTVLEETVLSHLEILKERLDKKKSVRTNLG